jgi:hypothetical protein
VKRLTPFAATALLLASSPAMAGEESAEDRERVRDHRGFALKLSAGGALRKLYSVPVGAVDLTVAPGAQTSSGGWFGVLGVLVGQTESGNTAAQLRLGASWELPLGPVHLGLSPRVSLLSVTRATTGNLMLAGAFGGAAFVTWDVIEQPSYVVYVGLEGAADDFEGNGTTPSVFWGGTIALGVRVFRGLRSEVW